MLTVVYLRSPSPAPPLLYTALPPIEEPQTSKDKPKPFKPSSPAKKVSLSMPLPLCDHCPTLCDHCPTLFCWYFLPQAGGCKAGTFDHYPKHSEDPYSPAKQKSSGKDSVRKIFKPSPGPKSMPTKSVVTQSVHRCVCLCVCALISEVLFDYLLSCCHP